MKKYILLLALAFSILNAGCDPHKYNTEADKQCQAMLKSQGDANEILLYALKNDASPSTIKNLLKIGSSPSTLVGTSRLPIICFAQSPEAVKIIYHSSHNSNSIPVFITENQFAHFPLFYYQNAELCEAYIDAVLDRTEYGTFVNQINGTTFNITRESVRNFLVGQKDEKGRTALFYSKNKNIINYWIKNGCSLNMSDKSGKNVLGAAIDDDDMCNVDLITCIIESGANVNFGEEKGHATPIDIALKNNRSQEIIDLLVSKGAKVKDVAGTSNPFFYVRTPGQVDFLKKQGASPEIEATNGFYVNSNNDETKIIAKTPLAKAVATMDTALAESLINAGADPLKSYYTVGKEKISLLYYAALSPQNEKMLDLLIKFDVGKYFDADKVFAVSIKHKNMALISKLLNAGLLPPRSEYGDLFKLLLIKNDIDNIKKMISAGFDINRWVAPRRYSSLLSYYLDLNTFERFTREDVRKFEILIDLGFNVNKQDSSGNNLLHRLLHDMQININELSTETFEKIIRNTNTLRDRSVAEEKFKELIREENIEYRFVESFMKNVPVLDDNSLKNILISIFFIKVYNIPDKIIVGIINHIKDLNGKVNGKTMMGYALEYDNVSLDIIKAIAEKMDYPQEKTLYKCKKEFPSSIASNINREDIANYLLNTACCTLIVDGKRVPKYNGLYLGMDANKASRVINLQDDRGIRYYTDNGMVTVIRVSCFLLSSDEILGILGRIFGANKNVKIHKRSFKYKDINIFAAASERTTIRDDTFTTYELDKSDAFVIEEHNFDLFFILKKYKNEHDIEKRNGVYANIRFIKWNDAK